MVMGKKAYLFCRDLDACKRTVMMYSLFGACKVLDKNPVSTQIRALIRKKYLCCRTKNI